MPRKTVILAAAAALALVGGATFVRRRRRQRAGSAAAVAPEAAGPTVSVKTDAGFTIGTAVQYPPRIATLPLIGVPGAESAFIIVDDLLAAPADTVAEAVAVAAPDSDVDGFFQHYAKQCRFLSDAEKRAPIAELAAPAGAFTHGLACEAFAARMAVVRDAGVVLTLVVMGPVAAQTQIDGLAAAVVTDAIGAAYVEAADDESSRIEVRVPQTEAHPTLAVSVPTSAVVPDDRTLHDLAARTTSPDAVALACSVAAESGRPLREMREALSLSRPQRVFVSESLGIRFVCAPGSRVVAHRSERVLSMAEPSVSYYPDGLPDDRETAAAGRHQRAASPARIVLQRATLPESVSGETDDDEFVRRVALIAARHAGDRPQARIGDLAGTRAAIIEQTDDGVLCRTYVCPMPGEAVVARFESASKGDLAALVARFADTFFVTSQ